MTIQTDDDSDEVLEKPKRGAGLDRPKKLESLIDTQAMRFLEGMDFQSFNNLSSACEQFMMQAPLFQSDVSFANAAGALDLTAQLFPTIDTDKNNLLSREEFAYLLLKTDAANRQALAWLTENFNAFTQACFFQNQIGKDDIEAARNVFHGLKIAKDKFGFDKQPTKENLKDLDADKMKDFLDKNGDTLNPHETAGLKYLLEHIKKHGLVGDSKTAKPNETDAKALPDAEKTNLGLAGVLDQKSLRTLSSMKQNNLDSLFGAFNDFIEDRLGYRGETPFTKAANAFDSSASVVSDLGMDRDHKFTHDELTIVSKLTQGSEKKQVSWIAKHFDAFTKALFFPGKASRGDLLAARNVFHGLDFARDQFENAPADATLSAPQIRQYLSTQRDVLDAHHKVALEDLVQFMEKRA